jgi:hypothetical protein
MMTQVAIAAQARNLERGSRARKSKAGRTLATRRGPWKAVVGRKGEGPSVGATKKNPKKEEAQEGSERATV